MSAQSSTRIGAADHGHYVRAYESVNQSVPHRQGLDPDEFKAARLDPRTVSAPLLNEPDVLLPVVTPLSVFDWISAEFFAADFPEVEAGNLYHLASNPELLVRVDGEPVAEWLRRTAGTNHLVVVDFPVFNGKGSTNVVDGLPIDVQKTLANAGVEAFDVETIGVQHYFDGTMILRDRSKIRNDGPIDISATYKEAVESGALDSLTAKGVRMLDVIEGPRLAEAWLLYEAYIGSLNFLTPIVESLDFETFEREMKDPRVNKFVSMHNGRLMSMMFLSSDLARYGWLSPSYLATNHFADVERGTLFEFPCLFTDVSARGLTHTAAVLRLACQIFEHAGIDAKIKFDCPAQTQRSVTTVVKGFVNRGATTVLEPVESCQQQFLAFRVR